MQKYDSVTLYDKEFKVYHSINQAKCVPYLPYYPSIFDVYTNITEAKITRWCEWCDWFQAMHSDNFGVYSYNPYYFTIGGTVEFLGGMYYVYSCEDRRNKKECNILIPMEY